MIWKPKTGHRNRRGTTWRKTDTQLCICFGIKSWVYLSLWDLIHHLIKDVFCFQNSPHNPSSDTGTRSRLLPSVGSCRPTQCTCWQIQIAKFRIIIHTPHSIYWWIITMATLLNITLTLVTLIKVDHLSTPLLQNTSVLLSPGQPICSTTSSASPCWPCHQQQVCGSQAQGQRQHGSPSLRACCSCNGESCWRWSGGESNIEMKVIDAEEHAHFTGMQDGGTLTGWRKIKVNTVAQKRQKWWSNMLTRL